MPRPKLNQAGEVAICNGPSWSKKMFVLKRTNPTGVTPKQLQPYAERLPGVARTCAAETAGMPATAERVRKMNSCVARAMGK